MRKSISAIRGRERCGEKKKNRGKVSEVKQGEME